MSVEKGQPTRFWVKSEFMLKIGESEETVGLTAEFLGDEINVDEAREITRKKVLEWIGRAVPPAQPVQPAKPPASPPKDVGVKDLGWQSFKEKRLCRPGEPGWAFIEQEDKRLDDVAQDLAKRIQVAGGSIMLRMDDVEFTVKIGGRDRGLFSRTVPTKK